MNYASSVALRLTALCGKSSAKEGYDIGLIGYLFMQETKILWERFIHKSQHSMLE